MEILRQQFSDDHKALFTQYEDGSITSEPITEDEYEKLLPYINDY